MSNQLAVVTGATSGIGLYIARGLAAAGYELVIVARDQAKANQTRLEIEQLTNKSGQVQVEIADLASLASVNELATRLTTGYGPIKLLVNNAGVFPTKKTTSKDGIELDLAVNHLAPFLLTWRLLPSLTQAGQARVVNVNSDAHEKASLSEADFAPDAPFKMMGTYGKSKLADMITTVELAKRHDPAVVTINAVHPGAVATNLGNSGGIMQLAWTAMKLFLLTPEKGADTPLWAATAAALNGQTGHYYKKRAEAQMNPAVSDDKLRELVWHKTLEMVRLPLSV